MHPSRALKPLRWQTIYIDRQRSDLVVTLAYGIGRCGRSLMLCICFWKGGVEWRGKAANRSLSARRLQNPTVLANLWIYLIWRRFEISLVAVSCYWRWGEQVGVCSSPSDAWPSDASTDAVPHSRVVTVKGAAIEAVPPVVAAGVGITERLAASGGVRGFGYGDSSADKPLVRSCTALKGNTL